MGKKVPYTNTTDHIIHIGPKTIWPGSTRDVDEDHIPDKERPKPTIAEELEESPLAEILEQNVPAIVDVLGALSDAELDELELLENGSDKPRKGLINAIMEERLSRASAAQEVKAFAEMIEAMGDDELAEQIELHAGDDTLVGLVRAEIDRRKQS